MEQQWKGNSDVLLFHQSPYTEMQRSSVWTLQNNGLRYKSSIYSLQILCFLRLRVLAQKHYFLHLAAFLKKNFLWRGQEQQQFCAVCYWLCISVKYLHSAKFVQLLVIAVGGKNFVFWENTVSSLYENPL